MKKKYESPKAEWISFLIADELASETGITTSIGVAELPQGADSSQASVVSEDDNDLFGMYLIPTIPD